MQYTSEKVEKRNRRFYPENLDVSQWDNIEPCLKDLLAFEINDSDNLILFMEKFSELQMMVSEEQGRRYIKMTCNTGSERYRDDFNDYYVSVVAKAKPYYNELDKKFVNCKHRNKLRNAKYLHLQNIVNNRVELFRRENVPLMTDEQELANKYSELISQMTVFFDGKEQTLAQLNRYMQNNDRDMRRQAWNCRYGKIAQQAGQLNELFDKLRSIRRQQSQNAGFSNYRDYKHQSMGRFAYSPQDVMQFHDSVEKAVLPYLKEITAERKQKLDLESVKPWDTGVSLDGKELIPYREIEELLEKAIDVLYKVDAKYGINLNKMKNSGLLDVENRKGKAPGGYNYPLRELGSSFIMMNAVGVHRDIVTLLHEAGHAMHSFATKPLHLMDLKECPHESAELASMAMEMLTMDYWNEYYTTEQDFVKAKKGQLIKALQFLPWCMTVDAFQQWIYTHPNHTPQERNEYFAALIDRFNTGVDWLGVEDIKKTSWLLQLHLFKYPFYYIEYGIAQLGAVAVYKNYRDKGEKAVKAYDDFLVKGYTEPLDKLYQTAGIKFDFSENYISELVDFVREEVKEYI